MYEGTVQRPGDVELLMPSVPSLPLCQSQQPLTRAAARFAGCLRLMLPSEDSHTFTGSMFRLSRAFSKGIT